MVAQTGEIPYGYSEIDLGDGRFEVFYETPVLRTSTSTLTREDDVETQKQRAYDLALWRAAQIAVERGYDRIVVDRSSSDADVEIDEDPYYPGYWPGWYGGYGYGYGAWSHGYYGRYGYSPFAYAPPRYRRDAYLQITVTLIVREAGEGDIEALDADATVNRLAALYVNAVYPGR